VTGSRPRPLPDSIAPQDAVTAVVTQMRVLTKDDPVDAEIVRIVGELRQPLRVAVVGKTKAGKSTLINSLVGAPVAPTDTLSCTRIVAWYRDHDKPDWAQARLRGGRNPVTITWPPATEPVAPGVTDDDIEDFHVWRRGLPQLDSWTVIDTPGYNESEPDVRERTRRVFAGETIDAVVFVLNGTTAEEELGFFTAVRADLGAVFAASSGETYSSPSDFGLVNTIAVLTRIDNGNEHDPFVNAQKIIAQNEVAMRGVTTTIIPVLGLLAEAARVLTDDDYHDLVRLTSLEDYEFAAQLFGAAAARAGLTDLAIERVPKLLGPYGMPLAVKLMRTGTLTSKDALAAALLTESKLDGLEQALRERFTDRTDALKARTAVRALDRLCRGHAGLVAFRPQLSRILHLDRMHTLLEYEAYERWKSGTAKLRPRLGKALTTLALRQDAAVRGGLEPGATDAELTEALWQRLAEVDDFLSEQWPQPSKDIARVMRRSYSLMLEDLKPGGDQ
jgi:50S ribosome-binding GTPase